MGYLLWKKEDPFAIRRRLAMRPLRKNKTSKYRGVSKRSHQEKPYIARIIYLGKNMYLGAYATELEAAHAYNAAAVEMFGEYAVLNEIIEDQPSMN